MFPLRQLRGEIVAGAVLGRSVTVAAVADRRSHSKIAPPHCGTVSDRRHVIRPKVSSHHEQAAIRPRPRVKETFGRRV